jgi:hypothetical protein
MLSGGRPPTGPTDASLGRLGDRASSVFGQSVDSGNIRRRKIDFSDRAECGFQFCVIDPQGDYARLERAVTVGDAKTPPSMVRSWRCWKRREGASSSTSGAELASAIMVTLRPDLVAPPTLEAVRLVLVIGTDAAAAMRSFCERTGHAAAQIDANPWSAAKRCCGIGGQLR